MTARLAHIAILVAIASGCYGATPAVGLPCAASGACPEGQECDLATDTCVLIGTGSGTEVDAAVSDAVGIDASIDIDAPVDAPAAVAPQFRSFSSVDNGTPNMTVASPPNVALGDLLIAHVSVDAATMAEINTPVGWTQITGVNGDNAHCIIAYYRFVTNPAASYTWNFPNAYGAIRVMAFSGVDPLAPIDAFATAKSLSTQPPTAPSINTTQPQTLLVVLLTHDLNSTPLPPIPNMTPIYSQYTGELNTLAASSTQPTAGATGPRSTTASSGPTSAISLALAPN